MTIGERIKLVRTSTEEKMSMAAFANRLGVTSGAVSQWENNQKIPSNSIVVLISKEFNVNETWLRTGDGEMFAPTTRNDEIANITNKLLGDSNPIRLKLMKLAANLTDEQLVMISEMAKALVEAVEKDPE